MSNQIKVHYVDHMGHDKRVVNAARISFDNNELEFKSKADEAEFVRLLDGVEEEYRVLKTPAITEKDEKLINYLARHKHYTPFEHCILSTIIECPLDIRSQIHRHRTFSYNEVSRRYTSDGIEFFNESEWRVQHKTSKQCSDGKLDDMSATKCMVIEQRIYQECMRAYNDLIAAGCSREQARRKLPIGLMTKFYMTGNLRNWIQFLVLRLDSHAQEEAQIVAKEVAKFIKDKFPVAGKALLENI